MWLHPDETELARCADGDGEAVYTGHLRGCARCRTMMAEHRWLARELGRTLALVARAVPVPRLEWRAVQDRLVRRAVQQRRRRFAPALATLCLTLALTLAGSYLLGAAATAQAHTALATIPAPPLEMTPSLTSTVDLTLDGAATPTPALATEAVSPSPATPVPVPTPAPSSQG